MVLERNPLRAESIVSIDLPEATIKRIEKCMVAIGEENTNDFVEKLLDSYQEKTRCLETQE